MINSICHVWYWEVIVCIFMSQKMIYLAEIKNYSKFSGSFSLNKNWPNILRLYERHDVFIVPQKRHLRNQFITQTYKWWCVLQKVWIGTFWCQYFLHFSVVSNIEAMTSNFLSSSIESCSRSIFCSCQYWALPIKVCQKIFPLPV